MDVDRDRLVAGDADDAWEPRSMLAVIDALEALRWAFILLEYGHEFDVNELFDDFIQKARQRPQQLDNFRSYYESASWKLCQELRAGCTFAEAVASVKEDLRMYQEIMSRPASPGNRATGLGASGTRLRNDSMRRARARILPRSQGPFGIPSRSNGMISRKPHGSAGRNSRSLRRRESGAPGVVASRSVLRHPCHIGCRSKRLHPCGHLGAKWLKNSRQLLQIKPGLRRCWARRRRLPHCRQPRRLRRPRHPALRSCHRPRAPAQGPRKRRRCHLRSFTWTSSRA